MVSVVVLRILAKSGIRRTTFQRWHEVQAEKEETTAGDGSSVYVVPLSVCRDVASIRLLSTSLCRNDKEDGNACLGNDSMQDKGEKGSDLGCRGRRSCDSLRCRRLASKEGGHESFGVVTVNRRTGQGGHESVC